uniref:DNA-directed DNA polymerase n=1 Tax=Globodera rostochiensis TaxID=31243 RepID=A0A914H847_GLORO
MKNKQREQALELMGKTGIDGTGRSFGVEHLEGVQAFWDKEYPDMFRIVAFDTKRGLKPVFKSENVRKYEVCVISDNGHWDGMKSVSRPERHTIECRERCKNCCRMGFGYPCKKESGPDLHCDACNKDFYSEGCFEEHKKKALPKYRIVAYDMETAASEEREHIPNLISAAHTCTDCCEEKNKECDICVPGPRLITWSAADGIDPLSEFIDWILGFKNADTIAFAQYGGRYDSHFVLTGDAYSGGRTMPFCLFAEASENVEIAMFDIISLYPSVNYDTPYPVGIPKIVKRDEDVLWLLFPLCGTCGKKEKKEFVLAKDEKKCAHNEEERALLGTFTSIELRKALELGYKVTHFYRAYHFEEFDNQLFKGYVRMFLKIKVEASGWPPEVKTEEEKRGFIEMYRAKYAICLDRKNMKKNPGLSENKIIKSADEWVKIMQDDRLLAS